MPTKINRDHFDRIVHKHRGHRILAGDDVHGVAIDYQGKQKIWETARDVKHAISKIDEAKSSLEQKLA